MCPFFSVNKGFSAHLGSKNERSSLIHRFDEKPKIQTQYQWKQTKI